MGLSFADQTAMFVENYGSLIIQAFTQYGPENELVPSRSFIGALQQHGRVSVGGADMNDRHAREWAIHTSTTTAISYDESDNYPAATQSAFAEASIDWKRVGVTMSWDELVRAAKGIGRPGYNHISFDVKAKLKALVDKMEAMLATDGTGNSSKDFTGFLAALSASNTYAGISQSANSYWQAQVDATGGALSKSLVESMIETLDGVDATKPGLEIWMPLNQWNRWKNLFVDSIRYAANDRTSEGMTPVYDNGAFEIPIRIVRQVPTTEVWFLNVPDWELRFLDQIPSDELSSLDNTDVQLYAGLPVGFKPIYENRDVVSVFVRAWGNLICSNPRHQGILTGLTA